MALIAVGPPTRLTRYTVFLASWSWGFSVAVVRAGFNVTAAATGALVVAWVSTKLVPLTPVTAALKFARMLAPLATLVASAAGVVVVTTGASGASVVKLQREVASGTPALLRIAVGPPVNVTV